MPKPDSPTISTVHAISGLVRYNFVDDVVFPDVVGDLYADGVTLFGVLDLVVLNLDGVNFLGEVGGVAFDVDGVSHD